MRNEKQRDEKNQRGKHRNASAGAGDLIGNPF
jgi:hypothetical protein